MRKNPSSCNCTEIRTRVHVRRFRGYQLKNRGNRSSRPLFHCTMKSFFSLLQTNVHGTSVKQKLTALPEKLKYAPVYNFYELNSSNASCRSASFDGILTRCKVGILTCVQIFPNGAPRVWAENIYILGTKY